VILRPRSSRSREVAGILFVHFWIIRVAYHADVRRGCYRSRSNQLGSDGVTSQIKNHHSVASIRSSPSVEKKGAPTTDHGVEGTPEASTHI
jgi:hypothetical protein